MSPLAIDLFCGLGGWTDGLLAEGWDVVGFDLERHRYPERVLPDSGGRKVPTEGVDFNNPSSDSRLRSFNYANEGALKDSPLTGGWTEYPAQLVLQDVLTLHGSQFRDADLIVASPPCQEFSYMAMPWSRAKKIAEEYVSGERDRGKLTALFGACFRIQREACQASGRNIPLIVENVRGAQKWVGRSRWNYGSFHLWGDVPALMPMTMRLAKVNGHSMNRGEPKWNMHQKECVAASDHINGRKAPAGTQWFNDGPRTPDSLASSGSKSSARKAASAMIAKIPYPLAAYIAKVFKP